ncbi:MAG TPA: hypothetical protein VNA87_02035 [Actinomycetota bacterium]|nr:hypothetical protein [Actinomycetota bacterium]
MGGAQPIDRTEFAKHLRGARALAALLSDEEVAKQMRELGFEVTKWRVYAWMKGESLPRLDEWIGLLIVLKPPDGFAFFRRCFRPDIYDRYMKLFDDET